MTDEELIARLRELDGWVMLGAHTHLAAADRITALLARAEAAEAKVEKLRGALTNLPAVYAHQINTGVREVYDPLQRFYTMESVLTALKGADYDRRRTDRTAAAT